MNENQEVLDLTGFFIQDELDRRDKESIFSNKGWEKLFQNGLTVLKSKSGPFDFQYHSTPTWASKLFSLGSICPDNGLLFGLNAHLWGFCLPISLFATEEQKTFLSQGLPDKFIGSIAISEKGKGSSPKNNQTRAQKSGASYFINGKKWFITNAPLANAFLIFANTTDRELTCFFVERESEGLKISPPIQKMGLRTVMAGEVILEDVKVHEKNIIGKVGQGLTVFQVAMAFERTMIAQTFLGTLKRIFNHAKIHVKENHNGDKRTTNLLKLAEIFVNIEASEGLLKKSLASLSLGKIDHLSSSAAKLFFDRIYIESVQKIMGIYGSDAYVASGVIEREVRDSLASQFYSGTPDVQLNTIARLI